MQDPTPIPNQEPHSTQTQHHRDVLNDLVDMGHAMARRIHASAMAEPATPEDPAADLTIPFDRIARAVRRTLILVRTHDAPSPVRTPRASSRRRILRTVEDIIARKAPADTRDALQAELHERVERPDLAESIGDDIDHGRSIHDIIGELCDDLGLATPGMPARKRRTPADIATLIARAAPRTAVSRANPPHQDRHCEAPLGAAAIQGSRTQVSRVAPEPQLHVRENGAAAAAAAVKPPW